MCGKGYVVLFGFGFGFSKEENKFIVSEELQCHYKEKDGPGEEDSVIIDV